MVVGDRTAGIIERSGDAYRGVAITDAHQREPLGLARALLGADPYIEDDNALLLGETMWLPPGFRRHREQSR